MKFQFEARKRTCRGPERAAACVARIACRHHLRWLRRTAVIDLDHNQILLNLRKEAFHSSVLTLDIDGQHRERRAA
jgi:hypothetical protein